MHKVQRRGGFSDRNKIKVENTEMQYKKFDDRTKAAFINGIIEWYEIIYTDHILQYEEIQYFFRYIISDVYAEVIGNSRITEKYFFSIITNTIYQEKYDAVLTLIEAIAQYFAEDEQKDGVYEDFNNIFEREYVGYRFVGNEIMQITDENEIATINEAVGSPYDVVNMHISKAISHLANREKPDYENSIKESISAVEALCEIYTGIKGKEATLGNMLKKIEESGVIIHGALKSAFNILYGYTSDANGIRHAGDIGGPSSTFEEAKFMLVSCSAFINYLIGVSTK